MLHFHAFMYCLMAISLHSMCVQCESVDPCKRVMLLVKVGYVYIVCGPALISMSPAMCSVRRTDRANLPPTSPRRMCG